MKNKKCICCKTAKLIYGNQKYCNSCALFTRELRRQVSYYKHRKVEYCKLIYGTKSGSERLRR